MKWCLNFSAALLASLTLLNSCKHSTEPPISQPDTTTHNFSWQVILLGDGNGSRLNDVAIVDDTLAYAAGEIYLHDTLGNWDPEAYNLAKWDGSAWILLRIDFYTICGQSSRTAYPTSSLLAFGTNDVWIAMKGDQVARWNGDVQTGTTCLPVSFSIKKLWGDGPNSVFAVGYAGNILSYSDNNWTKLQSGTNLPIEDVWGSRDPVTGEQEILCIASSGFSFPVGKKLLRVRGTTVEALSDSGLAYSLRGIWHTSHAAYFVVGDGIFSSGSLGPNTVWGGGPLIYTQYYTNAVRGNVPNDVFVVGDWGEVLHYNGSTWKSFHDQTGLAYGSYWSVAVKGDLVIAVGDNFDKAVVAVGRRRD